MNAFWSLNSTNQTWQSHKRLAMGLSNPKTSSPLLTWCTDDHIVVDLRLKCLLVHTMNLALLAALSFPLTITQQPWVGCQRATTTSASVLVMSLTAMAIFALTTRTSLISNGSAVVSTSVRRLCFATFQTKLIRRCLRISSTKPATVNTISCICVLISQTTAMSVTRSSISKIQLISLTSRKPVQVTHGTASTATRLRKYLMPPSKERTALSRNSATAP
ncbi:hypothetical protein I7I53_10941 [Histoplasma capsulatum var. duboisii H88]|uniref:Uncharacterized protein n=1 Tax=Ajellomyces capsulatus (strain H88) TaxID=544711 RepID=A0A8A1L9L0_AJEC8|nr:hypothetical protein I7I53_10941 [Histoplasma capsulatum var. duboisii H88]